MYVQPSLRLAQLRKEKHLSQKEAAQHLGISQALLSHYERGIRECNLSFLVRAASFYKVSCDYLLGVSMDKSNVAVDLDQDYSDSNILKGSISAAMARRLLTNSLMLLFDVVEKYNHKELSQHCMDLFALQIYKLYYYMYQAADYPQGYFTLPKEQFPYLTDISLITAEMTIKNIVCNEKWIGSDLQTVSSDVLPTIDHDALEKAYPALAPSFFNVLRNAQLAIDRKKG